MALYTFIMEYAGGTYVSQVKSTSPKTAIKDWAQKLAVDSLQGLDAEVLSQLTNSLMIDSPMPIEGIYKTWCISATIQGKLALVNFVQTYEE